MNLTIGLSEVTHEIGEESEERLPTQVTLTEVTTEREEKKESKGEKISGEKEMKISERHLISANALTLSSLSAFHVVWLTLSFG